MSVLAQYCFIPDRILCVDSFVLKCDNLLLGLHLSGLAILAMLRRSKWYRQRHVELSLCVKSKSWVIDGLSNVGSTSVLGQKQYGLSD